MHLYPSAIPNRISLYMTTAGGQIPIFCPKPTPNIDIIQRTSIFAPFDNAKQPQIYIQDKV